MVWTITGRLEKEYSYSQGSGDGYCQFVSERTRFKAMDGCDIRINQIRPDARETRTSESKYLLVSTHVDCRNLQIIPCILSEPGRQHSDLVSGVSSSSTAGISLRRSSSAVTTGNDQKVHLPEAPKQSQRKSNSLERRVEKSYGRGRTAHINFDRLRIIQRGLPNSWRDRYNNSRSMWYAIPGNRQPVVEDTGHDKGNASSGIICPEPHRHHPKWHHGRLPHGRRLGTLP